jgi:hypothetical protein
MYVFLPIKFFSLLLLHSLSCHISLFLLHDYLFDQVFISCTSTPCRLYLYLCKAVKALTSTKNSRTEGKGLVGWCAALKWVEVWLHSLETSTLDGHECSALRPRRPIPREIISCTHLRGKCVSSRISLDIRVMLTWSRTTIPWVFIPWACRCTTYGSSMPTQIINLQLKAIIRKSRYTIIRHIHQDHHSAVCLTTGPQPLPNWVIHSAIYCFLFQFSVSSLSLKVI